VGGAVDENGELAGVRDGGLGQNAENVPRVDRAWAHPPAVRKKTRWPPISALAECRACRACCTRAVVRVRW